MENITHKFDEIIKKYVNIKNEYIVAFVSVGLLLYMSLYAPKLPNFVVSLFDNILVKILLMFFLLYVSFSFRPSVALMVTIFLTAMVYAFNTLKKDRVTMAIVSGENQDIPQYTHTVCGKQSSSDSEQIIADGPISGVTNAEMESLYMHIQKKDKQNGEIISESNFSELIAPEKVQEFASHQYVSEEPAVKCADPNIGYDAPFQSFATAV